MTMAASMTTETMTRARAKIWPEDCVEAQDDGIASDMTTSVMAERAGCAALIRFVVDSRAKVQRQVEISAYLNFSHTAFAISRSLNFWILPVEVFGIAANTR